VLRVPLPHQPLSSFADCAGHPSAPHWDPVDEPAALSRLRWWLGHQAAFVTWRLIAQSLTGMLRTADRASERAARASALYDTYSALFLYSGSCGAETYNRVLRPAMRAEDPAFTGRWAQDYAVLPSLLREVKEHCPAPVVAPIIDAVRLNHRVHMSVANRLVPDGESLLRETGRVNECTAPDRYAQFDRFFNTERGPVCRQGLIIQYTDRLTRIVADIRRNGLYFEDPPQRDGTRSCEHLVALEQRMPRLFVELHDELHGELLEPADGRATSAVC
jgi:hypothetical protein